MKRNLSESPDGSAIAPGKIPVGGFLKQSMIDFPGHVTAVVFTQGCNFRCIYCHNPELIPSLSSTENAYDSEEILRWTGRYRHLLDAVTITGGEPTLHPDLPAFIRQIKSFGLKVKLDTNGSNPDMLTSLLAEGLIDYVAMDIKAPPETEKYRTVAGKHIGEKIMKKIIRSMEILKKTAIQHEYRTTLVQPYHTQQEIHKMITCVNGLYYLQKADTSGKTLTKNFQEFVLSDKEKEDLEKYGKKQDVILSFR